MIPRYLLDTNTVSYLITGRPPEVRRRIAGVGLEATAISVVTEAELMYGLARKAGAIKQRIALEIFLSNVVIRVWDSSVARTYGLLRAEQERKGRSLSTEDLMIAAHALSLGLILVTYDQTFSFVDGLRTEDWTIP
jgi:tRNA(fMet)-specific endonuclease VapC